MSNKTKLIIGLLFLVQIGVIVWSRFDYEANKTPFEKQLDLYLEDAENVRQLDFQGFELNELPESILKFQNVEVINLYNNQFEYIPTILYELPNLKRLNMSENRLDDVSLQKFEQLTHLDLSHNQLKNINGQSYNTTLKNVNLSHNELTYFLTFRIDLDTIDMAYNQLSNFRDVAAKLSKTVQHLDLSNNKFYNFDDARLILNNCYSLDLSNNQASYPSNVPATFFNEDFLIKKLFLNNCSFQTFDNVPASRLEVLDIGDNRFTISDNLKYQLTLKELNLEGLHLRDFQYLNPNLKKLNIADVFIEGDLELMLPNLEVLHISNKSILNYHFPNLKTIYFYGNIADDFINRLQIKYPNADLINHN